MSNQVVCGTGACVSPQGICVVPARRDPAVGIEYTKRHRCCIMSLAMTQLFLGIFLVGIGISALAVCSNKEGCGWPDYDSYYYYYGGWTKMSANIWGGLLVIVFASFGLGQVCHPSSCTIGANLGLSIFGLIIAGSLCGVEAVAAIVSWHSVALIVLHSTASFFYFVLFILFIVSASKAGAAQGCCGGCCDGCCCDPYSGREVVSIIPAGAQPHVVTLSNGQTVLVQGHPQIVPQPSFALQPPQYNAVTLQVPSSSDTAVPQYAPQPAQTNPSFVSDIPEKV